MAEILNGFTLLAPFHNKNAGFSRWTTATRDGERYFVKEFVNPVYPDENTLTRELRESRIRDCLEFETAKKQIYSVINQASNGNLVRITDFFRSGSHYYIAMPLIEAQSMPLEKIAELPLEDRKLLCLTAADSLLRLHLAGIVHADVKSSNVLVKKTSTGKYVAKIIDFDSSIWENRPPRTEEEIGGDQVYMAPEALLFLCGEDAKLTRKMDVFSLGVLFHQYLTGELPSFDKDQFDYVSEAVLENSAVKVSPALPGDLAQMIEKMLEADPDKRIGLEEVCTVLKGEDVRRRAVGSAIEGAGIAGSGASDGKDGVIEGSGKSGKKDPRSWFHAAGEL